MPNFHLPIFSRKVAFIVVFFSDMLLKVGVLISEHFLIFFMQIQPLVGPTKKIVGFDDLTYSWHDLVSRRKQQICCHVL